MSNNIGENSLPPNAQVVYYKSNNNSPGVFSPKKPRINNFKNLEIIAGKKENNVGNNASVNANAPEYTNHIQLIKNCVVEIESVEPAGNPKNTEPLRKEREHYKKLSLIIDDKIKISGS